MLTTDEVIELVDKFSEAARVLVRIQSKPFDGSVKAGNRLPCPGYHLREKSLFFGKVTLHLTVEVVPGESAYRDTIQSAVQTGLVRICCPGEWIRPDTFKAKYIITRYQLVYPDLLLKPRAVEEVLRPVFFPGQIGIVEIHSSIEQDLSGRSLECHLPNTSRSVKALENGDRILALLVDMARYFK